MRITTLTLLVILFCCCSGHKVNVGILPGKLSYLFKAEKKEINDRGLIRKYILIHYFNADCSTCLYELGIWAKYIDSIGSNNVDIYFIGYSENPSVPRYYMTSMGLKFDVFLDSTKAFLKENPFYGVNFTALTDRNFNIILEGSPIENQILREKYSAFF